MPLKEQDRFKLDSIVQQMVANGEKDSDIQFVVNDFKSKYDVSEPEQTEEKQGILGTIGGALKQFGGEVKEFGKGVIQQPKETGIGLAKGAANATIDMFGRPISKGLAKIIPGEDIFEKAVQAEKQSVAQGGPKAGFQATGDVEKRAETVGRFAGKAATGGLLATAAAPVLGAGALGTLGAGAVANVPFVPDAFEEGGAKDAAKDMALNTAIDILTLGGTKALPVVKKSISNILKGSSKEVVDQIAKEAIDIVKTAPTHKQAANEAAKRAGIPLTRGQEAQPINVPKPTGFEARVEALAGSLPGGKGVMQKQQQMVAEAATKGINKIKGMAGSDLNDTEAIGQALTGSLERSAQNRKEKLSAAYDIIRRAGNEGRLQNAQIGQPGQKLIGQAGASTDPGRLDIDSENLSRIIKEKVNKVFPLFVEDGKRIGKDIPSGLDKNIENEVVSWMDQIGNINKASTDDKYSLFRNIREKIGSKAYDRDLGFNEKKAYDIIYKELQNAEREHLYRVGGEPLVQLLDEVNNYFKATKDIADFSGKLIGAGKDVGQAGHVDPTKVLDRILKPKEWDKVQAIMTMMDEDAQKHLKAGLLMKIFDNSYKSDNIISLSKLKNNWKNKYGEKMLKGVLGDDVVSKVDDLITGLERARVQEIGMIDPLNPSGTGASISEKALMAAPILGGAWSIFTKDPATAIASLVGAAGGSYASRLAAKFMTRQTLNPIEKEVLKAGAGAVVGAGLGAATAEEGERLQGALTGAGVGAAGQFGIRQLGKLSNRGAIDLGSEATKNINPQVKSENFKKWFGDWENAPKKASKVVDESGAPIVVYHGTGDDITEFNLKKSADKEGRKRGLGIGGGKVYLTGDSRIASSFAQNAPERKLGKSPNVMPVYLDIKNPISEEEYKNAFKEFAGFDIIRPNVEKAERDAAIRKFDKMLKSKGIDGVIEQYSDGTFGQIAVFSPNQIKSAIGNSGEFSKTNPSIKGAISSSLLPASGIAGLGALKVGTDFEDNRKKKKELLSKLSEEDLKKLTSVRRK